MDQRYEGAWTNGQNECDAGGRTETKKERDSEMINDFSFTSTAGLRMMTWQKVVQKKYNRNIKKW